MYHVNLVMIAGFLLKMGVVKNKFYLEERRIVAFKVWFSEELI